MEKQKREPTADAMEDGFLTIREFAELAGVSRQAVYQRIKGLDNFTRQLEKGSVKPVTLISRRALALFNSVKFKEVGLQVDSQAGQKSREGVERLIDTLMQENGLLRSELEAQRQIIQDRDKLIAAKDSLIADYTARFAELAAQAQQITAQAQALHAADKPRMIGITSEKTEDVTVDQIDCDAMSDGATEDALLPEQKIILPEPGKIGEKPRRGWLARLFGMV